MHIFVYNGKIIDSYTGRYMPAKTRILAYFKQNLQIKSYFL